MRTVTFVRRNVVAFVGSGIRSVHDNDRKRFKQLLESVPGVDLAVRIEPDNQVKMILRKQSHKLPYGEQRVGWRIAYKLNVERAKCVISFDRTLNHP